MTVEQARDMGSEATPDMCRAEGPAGAVGNNWCHLPAGHDGHHDSPTAEWGAT